MQGPDAVAIIDAHAWLGEEYPFRLSAADLLSRMDRAGVNLALARPAGAELAVDNRAGNRRVLSAGPRIRGLATANPWFGQVALEEMRRARDEGAVGLFLHPSRQGFMPIEPVTEPLLELAIRFGWPVMFHTGTYIQSDVLAVAELARRMPEGKFICGGGGFADMWFELPGALSQVPNLWIDTSLIWGAGVEQLVRLGLAERVLFAGGEPRNRYAVVRRALSRLDLTHAQLQAILGDNARDLFAVD